MSEILNATDLKNEGNQLFKEKKFKEAVEKYMESLAYSNEDTEKSILHSNISATYCKLEDYGKALEHAAISTKKNSEWYKAWYRLSFVLFKLEKVEQAKKAIDRTLELCKEEPESNNSFEFIYDLKKDIYRLDKKLNADGNETEDEEDEKLDPKINLDDNNTGLPSSLPNGFPAGQMPNIMPMMDNMMKNDKIKSKLDSKEFQEKVMANQSNPFAMLNDPDMREIMGEMMRSMGQNN